MNNKTPHGQDSQELADNKYDGTPSVEASKKLMNAAGVRYYQYQPTGKKLEINV